MRLTKRQMQMLELVNSFRDKNGYSPTVREIADRLGLSSVATIAEHIDSLEKKGLVKRERDRSRSLELTPAGLSALPTEKSPARENMMIPLLGTIAAGEPIDALPNPEEIEIPPAFTVGKRCYALRVKGESMVGEGIFDGDFVVIEEKPVPENGETVVALLDGREVTLKKFYKETVGGRNRIRLQPANPAMEPIILEENDPVDIQGRVRGVFRVL